MGQIEGLGEMERKQEGIAVEYAGFWIRLGAYLIDVIILSIIGSIVIAGFVGYEASLDWENEENFFAIPALLVVGFIIEVAYYVGFWTWRGQTPDK